MLVRSCREDPLKCCSVFQEFDQLQIKHIQLQQVCGEQEKALSELGSHLSE